ncbi:MAG: heparinase II/III family protein [Gemmatimonadota bacterium]|nr:MAG: heparinase II/III family protein [Gemmatimonadota bacterium]
MLPRSPDDLAARREAIRGSATLRGLARRLRSLLDPLLDRPLSVPTVKPRLTRDGGVCSSDGTRLDFHPLHPRRHRCPRCGREHEGERHDQAWVWRYHLWLSERAIHLALLGALDDDDRLQRKAGEVLAAYARVYPSVPNRDNVLGPTHLFFSTYLESIWLAQLLIAAMLSRPELVAGIRGTLDDVVRESAQLIASFDEGWSNRQVWNNAALVAAGAWLGDDRLVERAVAGPHGLAAQLWRGVSPEGLWFEGENYHFFALRGFLLAGELLQTAGIDLYADERVGPRLRSMYLAPLDTLLPDLTLPARGDAPFGVSVVQRRFAELWEVGRARVGDQRLEALLAAIYHADAPPGEDPGLSAIAEQEQNRPPERFSRAQLGWKALCWMAPEPPRDDAAWAPSSKLIAGHGLAVLRGPGDRYVSLECGGAPGGHGHPDLLHLSLFAGEHVLADFGTGSYVSPSLHWYRSALAHNAPGRAGVGQLARHGWCSAFVAGERWSWCRAWARGLVGEGTAVERAVVVGPEYVLDVVHVDAPPDVVVDLPVHALGGFAVDAPSGATEEPPLPVRSTAGHEHGYDVLEGMSVLDSPLGALACGGAAQACELRLAPRPNETVFTALAPGPPDMYFADGAPLRFLVRRAAGAGRWVQCYALRAATVMAVVVDGAVVTVVRGDGAVDRFEFTPGGVRLREADGTTHTLAGVRGDPPAPPAERAAPRPVIPCPLLREVPAPQAWRRAVPRGAVVRLGEPHYRRSESPYGAAGPFAARVAVFGVDSRVCFAADVTKEPLALRDASAPELGLDNEAEDIHADGVQCYLGGEGWAGYVAVPDPRSGDVRIRAVPGTAADAVRCTGRWARTPGGYAVVVTVDVGRPLRAGDRLPVNFVINEMYPGRERRAGQLALSGGAGWVYLRGDRESPATAVTAEVS